jgi:curved DNA-binding protein CbpA
VSPPPTREPPRTREPPPTREAAEFERELHSLHDGLDRLSYYDFLGLRPGCDYVAIREAFYARAQRYHPDRFVFQVGDELRSAAYEVYKRMTEAYNVLFDPDLRAAYDDARMRGQPRLSELARARRLSADERQVSNTFARIYLRSAKKKLERQDVRGAWIDVQLGLMLEIAPPLVAVLEEIRRRPNLAQEIGVSS